MFFLIRKGLHNSGNRVIEIQSEFVLDWIFPWDNLRHQDQYVGTPVDDGLYQGSKVLGCVSYIPWVAAVQVVGAGMYQHDIGLLLVSWDRRLFGCINRIA